MQDSNPTPTTDIHDHTTQNLGIHEPGMDPMSPAAGNPSSDAGGTPKDDMTTVAGTTADGEEDDEE